MAAGFAAGAVALRLAGRRPHLAASPLALRVVAAAGAIGAVTASTGPTGWSGTDALLEAALGGALVLASAAAATGRGGPVVVAACSAVAVAYSGGSPVAAVGAGAALGLAAAVVASGERAPVLLALAGAGLAQAVLRFDHPSPTGASAAVATAAALPVLVAGLARASGPVRRRIARTVAGAVAFTVAGGALALVAAVAARSPVDAGVGAAREGLAAVQEADRDAAAERFAVAADRFDKAGGSVGAWWARPALAVPVVGQHVRALRTLTGAGADLAGAGADAARQADPEQLRLTSGGVDLDALEAVRGPLERALSSLERAARELKVAESPWLVAPVADRLDQLDERVRSATGSARTAVLAVRAAPGLLGADGERRYFLAIMTPAESRGSGGLMGNWGELIAEDGRIRLGRFGRAQDLNEATDPASRRISGPADYLRRYAPYKPSVYWQSVTMSPDFPTVARVITELYPQSGGVEVDGVIGADPYALAALLQLLGPISVDGQPEPLTAQNAAKVLLHDQYVTFAEPDRVDFLGRAAVTVFTRLTEAGLPSPRAVGDALGPAIDGRHLQLAARRPAEQRLFDHLGASGAVPRVRGDALGVVTQNFGGNKIDWFLRRSWTYKATLDPGSGQLAASLEVRLRNEAPATGLPRAVIGYGGTDPNYTSFGENLLLLSVYSPHRLHRATVDGAEAEVVGDEELGRNVYSVLVRIPAGQTRTVRLDLGGRLPEGERYRLDVARQPTVAADEADVSLALAGGWRIGRAAGLDLASPTSARAAVVVDRTRTFIAEVERGD